MTQIHQLVTISRNPGGPLKKEMKKRNDIKLKAIKLLCKGMTVKMVAEMFCVHQVTIRRWKKSYLEQGIEAFNKQKRKKVRKKSIKKVSRRRKQLTNLEKFFLLVYQILEKYRFPRLN